MTQPASPLDIPGVWRGERLAAAARTQATGHRALDAALAGGWHCGSLIQMVGSHPGLGFALLVPTLAEYTRQQRHVALISTPYTPYAPALSSRNVDLTYLTWLQPGSDTDALWSMEQATRSGIFAVTAYWGRVDNTEERRLQLAADAGDTLAFHFCTGARDAHSYAAVRLGLTPTPYGLSAEVLKCRGGRPGQTVPIRCAEIPDYREA